MSTNFREWPYQEALKVLGRSQVKAKGSAVLETGYGPSGLPHIGTLCEVARTSFVINALKILSPATRTTLYAFSDDMDGLRSIPENIPERSMLMEMLGRPLSSIPDPYGECSSYSENMNNRLKAFLTSFGFDFNFVSASDMYNSGRFNDGLTKIMQHHEEITKIFTATISEERRSAWSPFFPVCEKCGRIYTTVVKGYDKERLEILYSCSSDERKGISPCGFQNKVSILDGKVKVGWKIDWALRWLALGIDYEMHGEDLLDSASVSRKVLKVLGGSVPITYKYELFLDEEGRKISKKLGNGVSVDQWLRYAPKDALLYFMYLKPNQPKKMAVSLIPKAIDDYGQVLTKYSGEEDSPIRVIKAREIQDGTLEIPSAWIDFSLIVNLVSLLNASNADIIMEYLRRYKPEVVHNERFFRELVEKAMIYNIESTGPREIRPESDQSLVSVLTMFRDELAAMERNGVATNETIQTLSYEIAKTNGLVMSQWFRFLYLVLLGQERGPRIGSFVCLYGIDNTIKRLDEYLGN